MDELKLNIIYNVNLSIYFSIKVSLLLISVTELNTKNLFVKK